MIEFIKSIVILIMIFAIPIGLLLMWGFNKDMFNITDYVSYDRYVEECRIRDMRIQKLEDTIDELYETLSGSQDELPLKVWERCKEIIKQGE